MDNEIIIDDFKSEKIKNFFDLLYPNIDNNYHIDSNSDTIIIPLESLTSENSNLQFKDNNLYVFIAKKGLFPKITEFAPPPSFYRNTPLADKLLIEPLDLLNYSIYQIKLEKDLFNLQFLNENKIKQNSKKPLYVLSPELSNEKLRIFLSDISQEGIIQFSLTSDYKFSNDLLVNFDEDIFLSFNISYKDAFFYIKRYEGDTFYRPSLSNIIHLYTINQLISFFSGDIGIKAENIESMILFGITNLQYKEETLAYLAALKIKYSNKLKFMPQKYNKLIKLTKRFVKIDLKSINFSNLLFYSLKDTGLLEEDQVKLKATSIRRCKDEDLPTLIKFLEENKQDTIIYIVDKTYKELVTYSNLNFNAKEIVQLTKFNYYSQKYRAILDNIKFLELLIDTPLIKQLEKLQMLSNSLRMPNDIKSIQNRNFRVEPITSSEYFRLYHFDTTTDKNIIEEKYNIFKHNKVSYVIPIKQLNEKQDISFTVEDLPNSEYFIRESTNTNFNTKKKDFLIDFCDKIIETFSNKHHEDIKSYLYHELEMKLGPNTKEICGGVLYKSKDNTDVRTDTMSYNRIKHQVKKWINNDIYKFCHDKKINLNLISCLKEK